MASNPQASAHNQPTTELEKGSQLQCSTNGGLRPIKGHARSWADVRCDDPETTSGVLLREVLTWLPSCFRGLAAPSWNKSEAVCSPLSDFLAWPIPRVLCRLEGEEGTVFGFPALFPGTPLPPHSSHPSLRDTREGLHRRPRGSEEGGVVGGVGLDSYRALLTKTEGTPQSFGGSCREGQGTRVGSRIRQDKEFTNHVLRKLKKKAGQAILSGRPMPGPKRRECGWIVDAGERSSFPGRPFCRRLQKG